MAEGPFLHPEDLRADDFSDVLRQRQAGQWLYDRSIGRSSVEFVERIARQVGPEPFEHVHVAVRAHFFNCGETQEAVVLIGFVVFVVEIAGKAETGSMRVSARPEAQLHPLVVAFVRMVYERDVQLFLNPRIVLAMPFRESEQRLVAGVIHESFSELVTRGQIDAAIAESLQEFGTVCVEEVAET
jgi:hypothetical protein